MKDRTIVSIVAIASIAALEAIALLQNINGTSFALVIAILAGLGGYKLGALENKWGKNE